MTEIINQSSAKSNMGNCVVVRYINYWHTNDEHYITTFIKERIGEKFEIKEIRGNEVADGLRPPEIIISSVFGPIEAVKEIKGAKLKILVYGENPQMCRAEYRNPESKEIQETYDIVMGFNKTSKEKKQYRFPLWLMYYPYYKIGDEGDDIMKYLERTRNKNLNKEKRYLASCVASHDRYGQRRAICNAVSKYGNILCPGTFIGNVPKIGGENEDKIEFISGGVFNICPENSAYPGYYTEKVIQALEGGTIPIYWGYGKPEEEILDERAYCYVNPYNNGEMERIIAESMKKAQEHREAPLFKEGAKDAINRLYEELWEGIKSKL